MTEPVGRRIRNAILHAVPVGRPVRLADVDLAVDDVMAELALEATGPCPHVVTSDEGTSYCALAERQEAPARSTSPPGRPARRPRRHDDTSGTLAALRPPGGWWS